MAILLSAPMGSLYIFDFTVSYELFKRFFDGACSYVSEGVNSARAI